MLVFFGLFYASSRFVHESVESESNEYPMLALIIFTRKSVNIIAHLQLWPSKSERTRVCEREKMRTKKTKLSLLSA